MSKKGNHMFMTRLKWATHIYWTHNLNMKEATAEGEQRSIGYDVCVAPLDLQLLPREFLQVSDGTLIEYYFGLMTVDSLA